MIITNYPVDNNDFIVSIEANWQKLKASDKILKEQGILVGRYITEPHADGQAVYVIMKESKNRVKIHVVTGIGDDWIIPYWGQKCWISKAYALAKIKFRDSMTDHNNKQQ